MRAFAAGPSLRLKFTAAFVTIVIGGTVASTAIGTAIITKTLRDQARQRVRQGVEVTRMVYEERLKALQTTLSWAAASEGVIHAVRSQQPRRVSEALVWPRIQGRLDFLSYVDARTRRVARAGKQDRAPPELAGATPSEVADAMPSEVADAMPSEVAGAIDLALTDRSVTWTGVMSHEELELEGPALADRARVALAPDAASAPAETAEATSALALLAAVPLRQGDDVVGVLYGGMLLNRNGYIVDRARELTFGDERYEGHDVGLASIFLGDVRIATTFAGALGERALGVRASPDVAHAVLREGRSWNDRVWVEDAWRMAAYVPIRDRDGRIVGMMGLGMLEAPLLAERTRVMAAFLTVAAFGVAVVLGLTFLITGSIIRPLEQMVDATKKIAAGDLDLSVNVASRDEIGHLAISFNTMLLSLRATKSELQAWGHTLEEKVRERTEQLVAVQSRMAQSEKLASVGRLAAGVAHEINNPLGGILSLAMLALEDRDRDDPMRGDLEIIVKQTLRCREIVKGLLDFSRQSESRATGTQINPIVESTFALLERQAIFQNILASRSLKDGLPEVFVDPGQMQQVIVNIVINAVDAMEQSGKLRVETDLDVDAGEVVIRIADTGKGIPEDVLPFIFEPFFTTKKVGQGTGLGLAIVHGIVTGAGGRVEVASSGSGTTFTIRLPTAVPTEPLTVAVGSECVRNR